jgi:DNA-binding transcriptional MerR regulator
MDNLYRFRLMPKSARSPEEQTYPLRSAARITGLSPEVLRAWERRYGAVTPLRTSGGTRRYRASDLERLRLLSANVAAGHRIGQLVPLSNAELEQMASSGSVTAPDRLESLFEALEAFDSAEAQRQLSVLFAVLGPVRFAREVASPFLHEIGERWVAQRLAIASEHLATSILRSMLGSALQPTTASLRGARVIFATLPGEKHELGLLTAAMAALGAGANPLYLGPELPIDELLRTADRSRAAAVALSAVTPPTAEVLRALAALRGGLPPQVQLWIGGQGAQGVALPRGAEHLETLEQLEQRTALLGFEGRSR